MSAILKEPPAKFGSPEHKAKQAAAARGKVASKEARSKMALAKLGTTQTDETKAKRSEALMNREFTDETRERLAAAVLEKGDHSKLGTLDKELRLLTLIATGTSVTTAAQMVGMNSQYVHKYMVDHALRQDILDATDQLRALLVLDMPHLLAEAKKTLMNIMVSPTARNEVKVKAAVAVIDLAKHLTTADKMFVNPRPDQGDWDIIEAELGTE